MTEFTIGSQWKARGGWRAVVVTDAANGKNLCSWQNSCRDGSIKYHDERGLCYQAPDYDLIEPWKEPVVHEGFMNIYNHYGPTGLEGNKIYNTKENADESACNSRIACILIKFTEGEGL